MKRTAHIFAVQIEEEAAFEIARRSRGTPRIANRLLRRVRDFAQVRGDGTITFLLANEALEQLQVDRLGLDHLDHKLLKSMMEKISRQACRIRNDCRNDWGRSTND